MDLSQVLSPETYSKVQEELGKFPNVQVIAEDRKAPEYVPISRFETVNGALKTYKAEVTKLNEQIGALEASTQDVEAIKGEMAKIKANSEAEIAKAHNIVRESAIKNALMAENVKNVDIVSKLIDRESIEISENGEVVGGLSDQIKPLKKDCAYLFNEPKKEVAHEDGKPEANTPEGTEGAEGKPEQTPNNEVNNGPSGSGTGSIGTGKQGGNGKPENIGALLAKRRMSKSQPTGGGFFSK